MKKLFTFSFITAVVILMSDCSPKIAKTTTKTETKTNNESGASNTNQGGSGNVVKDAQGNRSNEEQIILLAQVSDMRIESGKRLYESTCNKCHELHSPASRNSNSWVEIMKVMGPKAKIEQGTYMMISSYLVKNSKG